MSSVDTTSVKDDKRVAVYNFTDYPVGYTTMTGITRSFAPGMELKVLAGELRELNMTPGGNVLLRNYLCVRDSSLAQEFGVSEDEFSHEYQWTANDIKRVLLDDPIEVLEDALNFAPEGIVESISNMAVELAIPDVRKRDLITERTGFDINARIANKALIEADQPKTTTKKKTRRAAEAAPAKKTRKAATDK